ncbi:hypothetical protein [Kibdelosporangium aridum]|nr:hypothetical protein [Kibdelosporangium aridum]
MPRKQSHQDKSLFPAKVTAALTSLAVMIGFLVISISRGPSDLYTILVAATALVTAIAISVVLYRHKKQR